MQFSKIIPLSRDTCKQKRNLRYRKKEIISPLHATTLVLEESNIQLALRMGQKKIWSGSY